MTSEQLLQLLVAKKNTQKKDMQHFMSALMDGTVPEALAAGVITALRMKGETAEEVAGCVEALRTHMHVVSAPKAIDIVGTGGDGVGTFNISTTSAFVLAGAGVPVAKHGNRAASSKSGSADVLEALGVNIALTPEQASAIYKKVGIVFLFAPLFHPALKHVVALRKALRIRTVFNILGPFANPAQTKIQIIGVPSKEHLSLLPAVAQKLGYTRALIVHSEDGMDEVSTRAKTQAILVEPKRLTKHSIDPQKLGFKKPPLSALLGKDAAHNAEIVKKILCGERGPARDIVVLNTAVALFVVGKVKSIGAGIHTAERSIDSGKAHEALQQLIAATHAYRV